jgi:hypothetical protein
VVSGWQQLVAPRAGTGSESGTVVPRSKTLRARRGGDLPPSNLGIPGSGLMVRPSRHHLSTSRNGQKTYGSVFGMIFFGGVGSLLVTENQQLAAGKIPKNRKNTKKSAK